MPPIDPSPRAGEVMHQPSQPPSPEPKPGPRGGDPVGGAPKEGTAHGSAQPDADKTDPVTGAGEDIAG